MEKEIPGIVRSRNETLSQLGFQARAVAVFSLANPCRYKPATTCRHGQFYLVFLRRSGRCSKPHPSIERCSRASFYIHCVEIARVNLHVDKHSLNARRGRNGG